MHRGPRAAGWAAVACAGNGCPTSCSLLALGFDRRLGGPHVGCNGCSGRVLLESACPFVRPQPTAHRATAVGFLGEAGSSVQWIVAGQLAAAGVVQLPRHARRKKRLKTRSWSAKATTARRPPRRLWRAPSSQHAGLRTADCLPGAHAPGCNRHQHRAWNASRTAGESGRQRASHLTIT